MNSTQITLEDFSLGQVGGLDGLVFGMDALAQGLGSSMARTARSLPPYGRGSRGRKFKSPVRHSRPAPAR